jgi:periplasmic protein TonB
MKKIFTLALIFLSLHSFAQKDSVSALEIDTDKEFKTVQIEAQFPGGTKGWINYLQTNLKAELGAKYLNPKKGETIRQTVIIAFLVDKEGKISEVEVINPDEVHKKLAAESVRVIKEGPNWKPAVQDGKKVMYRQKQSITWEARAE